MRINRGFLLSGIGLTLLGAFFAVLLVVAGVVTYYWISLTAG